MLPAGGHPKPPRGATKWIKSLCLAWLHLVAYAAELCCALMRETFRSLPAPFVAPCACTAPQKLGEASEASQKQQEKLVSLAAARATTYIHRNYPSTLFLDFWSLEIRLNKTHTKNAEGWVSEHTHNAGWRFTSQIIQALDLVAPEPKKTPIGWNGPENH